MAPSQSRELPPEVGEAYDVEMASNRRVLFHAALGIGASVLWVFACSSDNPPGAADGTGSSSGTSGTSGAMTSSGTTGSSGSDASSSSGSLDPDASSSSGDVDSGPPFQCYEDKSVSVDGGALPTSCPESASCSAHCTNIANHYKLGVAQIAIACLKKLPSCANDTDVRACVDHAMDDTCKDTTSATYCAPLVKPCDPNAGQPGSSIDEAGCEAFGSALNASGRTIFSDCIKQKIADGNCPIQVVACAAEIRL